MEPVIIPSTDQEGELFNTPVVEKDLDVTVDVDADVDDSVDDTHEESEVHSEEEEGVEEPGAVGEDAPFDEEPVEDEPEEEEEPATEDVVEEEPATEDIDEEEEEPATEDIVEEEEEPATEDVVEEEEEPATEDVVEEEQAPVVEVEEEPVVEAVTEKEQTDVDDLIDYEDDQFDEAFNEAVTIPKDETKSIEEPQQQLHNRARKASPNKAHLRLYESRKVRTAPGAIQKKKTLRTTPASPTKQASTQSLGTRAKKATPNAAHLRLYEAGLRKQRQKNGL